jgi:hypothetical protein
LKDSKHPDPTQPLTAHISVGPDEISEQHFEPWTWESSSTSGGVFIDMSVMTGVGAGLEAAHGPMIGLNIKSDHVHRSTFRPSQADLKKAVADGTVSRMLKRRDRPSVYLVSGLMVAHGAQIEVKKGQKHGGSAHAMIDVTATGTPIKTGVKGKVGGEDGSTLTQNPTSSFILAYQLVRLRKKRFSDVVDRDQENRWALFDDEEDESDAMDGLDIEYVTENCEWDDAEPDEESG